MSNDDLSFWMDSDSSGAADVSDDGDLPIPSSESSSVASRTPSQAATPTMRTRNQRPAQPDPVKELQLDKPPLKLNSIDISSDSDAEPVRVETNPQMDMMRWMKAQLARDIEALKRECTAEDDVVVYTPKVFPGEQKQEGDFTLVFETADGTEFERILRKNGSFVGVMRTLPSELQQCRVSIDGVVMDPDSVIADILGDYMKIRLEPMKEEDTAGFKKLSFAMPNGEKKKLLVDEQSTFGEVLVKLECPNARLFFDGYAINPAQKVCDNDEIEDGEQIDVKM